MTSHGTARSARQRQRHRRPDGPPGRFSLAAKRQHRHQRRQASLGLPEDQAIDGVRPDSAAPGCRPTRRVTMMPNGQTPRASRKADRPLEAGNSASSVVRRLDGSSVLNLEGTVPMGACFVTLFVSSLSRHARLLRSTLSQHTLPQFAPHMREPIETRSLPAY